jgi:DNA polymerase-3 subunit epsilon
LSLTQLNIVFVDCQTNGSAPADSQMIELGWMHHHADAASPLPGGISSSLIALRPDQKISNRILTMTGISAAELAAAEPEEVVRRRFLGTLPERPVLVVHYARFEKSFLEPWLADATPAETASGLPFLCTYEIARRIYPDLPSRSIRAVSGYLGQHVDETKRSAHHIEATLFIWNKLSAELDARGIDSLEALLSFVAEPVPKVTKKRYALSSEVRLNLPDQPGVYKMLGHDGRVLYVGKATSLRSRVNSYFRGQKTKGSRLNELVAQIAQVDYQITGCPMEAALTESDAIKDLNPPYNRAQKAGSRAIGFTDADLTAHESPIERGFGPFSSFRQLQQLRELKAAVDSLAAHDEPVVTHLEELGAEAEIVRQGLLLFRGMCTEGGEEIDWRRILCRSWSESILRARERRRLALTTGSDDPDQDEQTDDEVKPEEDFVWQPEDIARHVAGVFTGFAHGIHRGRWLNNLANCELKWADRTSGEARRVRITNGRYYFEGAEPLTAGEREVAHRVVDLATYDRMQVFMSELRRLLREGHQIELRLGANRTLTNRQIMQYVFPGDFSPDAEAPA